MTVREPRELPVILSPEEVRRLLDAAPGLKYKGLSSLFEKNDLTRVFQAVSPERNAGIYILAVGARTRVPPLYLIRATNGLFAAGGDALFTAKGQSVFGKRRLDLSACHRQRPARQKVLASAGQSMAIPMAASSPHKKPLPEPCGVQAASRS